MDEVEEKQVNSKLNITKYVGMAGIHRNISPRSKTEQDKN